jgi:hypothetical protein
MTWRITMSPTSAQKPSRPSFSGQVNQRHGLLQRQTGQPGGLFRFGDGHNRYFLLSSSTVVLLGLSW